MSRTLQFRRYNSATVANTIGANGELIINSTNQTITVHDGVTPGGYATLNSVTDNNIDQYARTTANSATSLAQSSYNYANTIGSSSIDSYARTTANTATNNITIMTGVNDTQNTRINSIETINTNQNNSITIIQGVDTTQNTRLNSIETIDINQNNSITIIQGVDTTQNTRLNSIETIDINQNNSITIIQGVDTTQNTRLNSIETINNSQNTSINAAAQTVPQNAQSTNYVLQLTDAGKHIYYTQASNTILYIPTTSNVAFSNGSTIMIVSRTSSSANITVSPNTGVTMYFAGNTTSASRNVTTYGMASLIQVASNTWFINGTGVS